MQSCMHARRTATTQQPAGSSLSLTFIHNALLAVSRSYRTDTGLPVMDCEGKANARYQDHRRPAFVPLSQPGVRVKLRTHRPWGPVSTSARGPWKSVRGWLVGTFLRCNGRVVSVHNPLGDPSGRVLLGAVLLLGAELVNYILKGRSLIRRHPVLPACNLPLTLQCSLLASSASLPSSLCFL